MNSPRRDKTGQQRDSKRDCWPYSMAYRPKPMSYARRIRAIEADLLKGTRQNGTMTLPNGTKRDSRVSQAGQNGIAGDVWGGIMGRVNIYIIYIPPLSRLSQALSRCPAWNNWSDSVGVGIATSGLPTWNASSRPFRRFRMAPNHAPATWLAGNRRTPRGGFLGA